MNVSIQKRHQFYTILATQPLCTTVHERNESNISNMNFLLIIDKNSASESKF